MAWHLWLQCGMQIAWLIDLVYLVAQGGDLECNAASHGKPVKITKKEINGVLLMCGYVADESNKLVLDSLHLVE